MRAGVAVFLLIALVFVCLPESASGRLTDSWKTIHEKCPSHVCNHEDHNILDWNEKEGCHCRLHPCHHDLSDGEDKAKKHACPDPKFPYLAFSFNKEKELECVCKEHPCPEDKCPNQAHKLLWNHNGECYCQSPEEKEL